MTGHFTAFVMWPINAKLLQASCRPTCRRSCSRRAQKAGDEMTRLTLELHEGLRREVQGRRRDLRRRRRPRRVPEGDDAASTRPSRSGRPACTTRVMAVAAASSRRRRAVDPSPRLGLPKPTWQTGSATSSRRSSPRVALVVVVARRSAWGVITRYVTAQPAAWAARSRPWRSPGSCSSAPSACIKYKLHPIDRHAGRAPAARRCSCVVRWLNHALVLGFCVFMAWFGTRFAIDAWDNPSAVLRLPLTWLYGPVAFCFALMVAALPAGARRRGPGTSTTTGKPMWLTGFPAILMCVLFALGHADRVRDRHQRAVVLPRRAARCRSTSSCRRW